MMWRFIKAIEFFQTQIDGLRTEDIVHDTDCGNTNKTDLIVFIWCVTMPTFDCKWKLRGSAKLWRSILGEIG